jgi:muramoyltetrapeptide carboxypeptidase LdcA involved in peptidoglycan recycling
MTDIEDFEIWQGKVAGTNISSATLLATDYLNHFNEIVMLLEMVPDMPDMIEDCKEWAPKTYQEHFRDSTFSDRELAIEAYDHVPEKFRQPFETTIDHMNEVVSRANDQLEAAIAGGNPDIIRLTANTATTALQRLMDVASAIIHGSAKTMNQDEIDTMMAV